MDYRPGDYLRPDYHVEKRDRAISKLEASLQALNNVHRTLHTIPGGGESAYLAQECIAEAYRHIQTLHKQVSGTRIPSQPFIDVNAEIEEEYFD